MTVGTDPIEHSKTDSHAHIHPPRDEVPGLTGLRFVAAFSVLIAHGVSILLASHETPFGAVYWLKQASGFGMTLFFVLSGFVIHYNYAIPVTQGGGRGIAAYLWARFARLYPLLLLMLVVYMLISRKHRDAWSGHPDGLMSELIAFPYFLLSIQSWIYLPIRDSSLIYVIGAGASLTWSISTEWFFYFVYPLLAVLILRLRRPLTIAVGVVLWCLLWTLVSTSLFDMTPKLDAFGVQHYGEIASLQTHQQDSFVRWLFYFSPYLRIGEFILGAIVAQLYVQLRPHPAYASESSIGGAILAAAWVSVFVITALMYSPYFDGGVFRKMNMNFALGPSAAVIIFCVARYDSWVSRLLRLPWINILGEASYSIYLTHFTVIVIVAQIFGGPGHSFAYDLTMLVLTAVTIFAGSVLLHRIYEEPARRWLRRFFGSQKEASQR